jgi:D-alanyl-lipoteichoic acid acyltransferase DltB (MBOAT superfamily)
MSLLHLLVFCALALAYRLFARRRAGGWLLFAASVAAVYWLQPAMPIRHLDFWLPTASLALATLTWAATRPDDQPDRTEAHRTLSALAALILAIGLTRYLNPPWRLTSTRPPDLAQIAAALAILTAVCLALLAFRRRRAAVTLLTLLVIAVFVCLKTETLAHAASAWLRSRTGQPADLASSLDLRWLGFSYLAFRLLHTLRDRISGKLPALSLREYLTYIVFFPALTAGPIDRAERFARDLRRESDLGTSQTSRAATRLLLGIFKKFVVADSLAIVALTPANAAQTISPLWLWLLLYGYAFQLYFDFSGYTDIAVGLGLLFGVTLPENFDRPYLKPNLTAFWNSWHMTLAGWFRAYFFNPLTRGLRTGRMRLPVPLVILIGQMSTMVLIGLWHGVTWNFALWGAWHGVGLFVHNRWTEFLRTRPRGEPGSPHLARVVNAAGILATFQFVVLGWVWFALPTVGLSWQVFLRLLGA